MKYFLMFFVGLIVLGIYADTPDPPLTEPFKNKEFYGVWHPSPAAGGKMTVSQTKITYENKYEVFDLNCPYLIHNGEKVLVLQCYRIFPDDFDYTDLPPSVKEGFLKRLEISSFRQPWERVSISTGSWKYYGDALRRLKSRYDYQPTYDRHFSVYHHKPLEKR